MENISCDTCGFSVDNNGKNMVCNQYRKSKGVYVKPCVNYFYWVPVENEGTTSSPDNYKTLQDALDGAYQQASNGKGKERHADDEPFENQKICQITRWLGNGPASPLLFQVVKKALESDRLTPEAAVHELQGVINYAAACIIILEERK